MLKTQILSAYIRIVPGIGIDNMDSIVLALKVGQVFNFTAKNKTHKTKKKEVD